MKTREFVTIDRTEAHFGRIAYAVATPIPGPHASSAHAVCMAAALSRCAKEVVFIYAVPAETANTDSIQGDRPSLRALPDQVRLIPIKVSYRGFLQLKAILRVVSERPQVLWTRDIIVAFGCAIAGVPTILERHIKPSSELTLKRLLLRLIPRLPAFRHFVAITTPVAASIHDEVPLCLAGRVQVLSDAADDPVRAGLSLCTYRSTNELTIGYVGSDHPGKGVEMICDVALRCPSHTFVLVGPSADRWPSAPSNMRFLGPLAHTEALRAMQSFDIALLPNQMRVLLSNGIDIGDVTSPMKFFEYLSFGLPIVASDLPILREATGGCGAKWVQADCPNDWACAIEGLVDPAERASLGRSARSAFVAGLSWDTRAARGLANLQQHSTLRERATDDEECW